MMTDYRTQIAKAQPGQDAGLFISVFSTYRVYSENSWQFYAITSREGLKFRFDVGLTECGPSQYRAVAWKNTCYFPIFLRLTTDK